MNRGENNDEERKTEQNFPESEEESETEYCIPTHEHEKEKSLTNKILLQKKRYNLENDENKKQYLKKESVKFTQRKKNIKHEKERSYENEISEDVKKDLENKIGKLENQLEYHKEEFMKFKQILTNQNIQQKNQIENQKNQIENMKNQIENQKIKMEYKSIEFQMKIKEVNEDINRLLQKINELQNQVNDLHQFNFQVMLRKLIKNLIEYLYNHYYPHFMHLNIFTKKVEFVRAPIIK